MKMITLTQGMAALVDDEDFEWLNQWKWYYQKSSSGGSGYAVRGVRDKKLPNGYKTVQMHRLINGTPGGFETDHINGDKLDNRRTNLRTASRALNRFNTGVRKDNKSGYKGVSWYKNTSRWKAVININGKLVGLGYYKNIEDAVRARESAEKKVVAFELVQSGAPSLAAPRSAPTSER